MFFCKNTSLLTGGNLTHKTSAGARTGIGRFVKRFLIVPGACQTSYDARPGTVRCPGGARPAFAHIGRALDDFCLKFISYDSVRCPAGHRTMSDKRKELSKIS